MLEPVPTGYANEAKRNGFWLPLTLSGNEITDDTRKTNLEGDGRTFPDSSVGIYAARRNECPNGDCTSTTGWIARLTGTFGSVATDDGKFTLSYIPVTIPLNTFNDGANIILSADGTAASGQTWTVSAWVKGTAGRNVRLIVSERTSGGSSLVETATANTVLTGDWQRLAVTRTFNNASTTRLSGGIVGISTADEAAHTVKVTAVQYERAVFASPYIRTTSAAVSVAAGRIQGSTARLNTTQGWFAARFRMAWGTANEPGSTIASVLNWGDGTNRIICYYLNSDNSFRFQRQASGAGSASPAIVPTIGAGVVITLVGRWTATENALSVDGGNFSSTANTSIPTIANTFMDIGAAPDILSGRELNSDFLWAAAGVGALDNADAAVINGYGNRLPRQLSAIPGRCVLAWEADDAYARARAA